LTLLDLQAKDAALAQLEHRRTTLPEHARIQALEARVRELDGQRVAAETEVGDLERSQAKFDSEIDLVRQRRVRDEDRLSSGAITNPKDLSSLQHELGALERRISSLEDEELEVMEQLEEAQSRLSAVSAEAERVGAELGAAFTEITAGHHRPEARRLYESLGYDATVTAYLRKKL
jgi:predicted  nucleic acid-binding Zn-ribbon protein